MPERKSLIDVRGKDYDALRMLLTGATREQQIANNVSECGAEDVALMLHDGNVERAQRHIESLAATGLLVWKDSDRLQLTLDGVHSVFDRMEILRKK